MLEFNNIELENKDEIEKYTKQKNYFLCEHCFVDIFMWSDYYNTMFAIEDDFLFIKMQTFKHKKTMYLCPIGNGDLKKAILKIKEHSDKNNIPFVMISIPEEIKKQIEYIMPDKFDFKEEKNNEDYVYLAEDLMYLKGKKFHSKRNFINRFKINYNDRWKYEQLSDENIKEMFNYQLEWCEINNNNDKNSFLGETCAISKALKNYKQLKLKGGLLRLDGKIIAFTLASKSAEDTITVHIEKADHNIVGSYQMINFMFAQENFKDIKYVD